MSGRRTPREPSEKLVVLADEYVRKAQHNQKSAEDVRLATKWLPEDNPWVQALAQARERRQFYCSQASIFDA